MTSLKKKKPSLRLSIPVSFLKEGSYFIAYTPVLDFSTSGKTFDIVKKRFAEGIQIFLEELHEKGTLEEVLTELGWRKVKKEWSPPVLVAQDFENFKVPAFC